MTRNGEKKAAFNQSSINVVAGTYGTETAEWIGKSVRVLTKKDVVAGKKVVIAYYVTEGWYLDDFGDLVKDEPKVDITVVTVDPTEVNVPAREYPKYDGAPTI